MNTLLQSLRATLALTVVCGVLYPLTVMGVAQVAFPRQAAGSLIVTDGQAMGSELVGQPFSDPRYLWGRPSGTSPSPYNAAASSGRNLGPTNPALTEALAAQATALREAAADPALPIPALLVTASGSGLDPHVSPEAAAVQVPRIAAARGLDEGQVREAVARATTPPALGLLGEPVVNVLQVNLALDATGAGR